MTRARSIPGLMRYALLGWVFSEPWAYPRWAYVLPWWWWRIYLVVGERALFWLWWNAGQPVLIRLVDRLDLDPVVREWRAEAEAATASLQDR